VKLIELEPNEKVVAVGRAPIDSNGNGSNEPEPGSEEPAPVEH
jgi:hypothetical protein